MWDWIVNVLFQILALIQQFAVDWGLSIIILVVIIRLLLTPLMIKSSKSTAHMQVLTPKIQEIQERYADDPQRQLQEMQKFYAENKFSPFGGCLPLLIQMPILCALFTLLQHLGDYFDGETFSFYGILPNLQTSVAATLPQGFGVAAPYVVALLLFAVLTIRAVAAVDVGVYGDVVAHRKAGDALPHLHHFAGVLVAQHHRRVHVGGARLPVVDVHIGAADAAHLVAQHQLPRPGVGRGQIGDVEGLIPEKTGRFHRNSSHPKVLGTIFAPKRALVKRETKRAATVFVAALCLDGITFSAHQWHR